MDERNEEAAQKNFKKYLSITSTALIPLSSLTSYHRIYFVLFFAPLTLLLLVYKSENLPLPSYAFGTELTILIFFTLLMLNRSYVI